MELIWGIQTLHWRQRMGQSRLVVCLAILIHSLLAEPSNAAEPVGRWRASKEEMARGGLGWLTDEEQALADVIEHQKYRADLLKGKTLRITEDLLLPAGKGGVRFKGTTYVVDAIKMECALVATQKEEKDRIVPRNSFYRVRTAMEPVKDGAHFLYRFDLDEVDEHGKVKPNPGLLMWLLCRGTNLNGDGEPNVLAYHILGSLDEKVFLKLTDEKDPFAPRKAGGSPSPASPAVPGLLPPIRPRPLDKMF